MSANCFSGKITIFANIFAIKNTVIVVFTFAFTVLKIKSTAWVILVGNSQTKLLKIRRNIRYTMCESDDIN